MGPGSHASSVRPRWGRISAAFSALVVTLVSVLGGVGLLSPERTAAVADSGEAAVLATAPTSSQTTPAQTTPRKTAPSSEPRVDRPLRTLPPVPAGSGAGERVVFDMSDQRVWLVDKREKVARSYLVSGSLTDNLRPGTYEVYSRSRWAVGLDDSGVMEYFVRFTRGDRAAIGFHSIPAKDGRPLQSRAQLGTPQSHGCIRQALPDAQALWDFAPVGTTVVVTD